MSDNFLTPEASKINIRLLDSEGGSCGSPFCLEEFKNVRFYNYIYEHFFKLNKVIGVFLEDKNNKRNNINLLAGTEVSLEEIIKDNKQYDWNRMEKIIGDFREESIFSRFCIPAFEYYKNNSEIKKFIYILSKDDTILSNKNELWNTFSEIILLYRKYLIDNQGQIKKKD